MGIAARSRALRGRDCDCAGGLDRDDLDATLAELRGQGIEPEREPYRVREGGSRLTFVRDPNRFAPNVELKAEPSA
jgi:hypothetical protein